MIFLIIPFALIELYLSLKTGETIGFLWSVIWIVLSFALGMALLQKSSQTMMGNMQSMKQGKLDLIDQKSESFQFCVENKLQPNLPTLPGHRSSFSGRENKT